MGANLCRQVPTCAGVFNQKTEGCTLINTCYTISCTVMFSCPHTFGLYCTFLIVCWRFWLLNTVSCFCIWHWLKYKSSDLQLFTFQFLSSDEKWTLNMQEGSSGSYELLLLSSWCYFVFLLQDISGGNIVLFQVFSTSVCVSRCV